MTEEVIEAGRGLTYKELKEILNTMSDKDLEETVFVEYKTYCKGGRIGIMNGPMLLVMNLYTLSLTMNFIIIENILNCTLNLIQI